MNSTIHPMPCFITGCGHSGTSLLLSILAKHDQVYAVTSETGIALKSLKRFKKEVEKLTKIARHNNKLYFIEKTPRHILHIDKILEVNRDSKVLLITRDGRDVAASLFRRSKSLTEGIQRWIECAEIALHYKKHPRIKVVSYESIIINFQKTISVILEFMGLDYDNQVEFFYQDNNINFKKGSSDISPEEVEHLKLRNWQMKQPLFDGRGSWKDLSLMQKKFISLNDEFQNLLKALNYI
jgi:hypothetical protein